ncbi:MAG: 1-(5-phosphoribosyl)-5-[(5-phosphoribosylamino)methylideneamino]imidazole-4-carboxamide isomerase, partial [Ignavibacteriales bacterium]|nr:1-(5-phosphoribosyl)-5-[(5-phosphoribosylamino)methylideneamino]imidazole-4-carboxamide isomerase [Ignavibacteriales bacterium]
RLRQGRFDAQTVYSDSPADVAKTFLDSGFSSLHVVDLEGAKNGRITNWDSLESLLDLPGVAIQVGGGIRSEQDIQRLLDLGARRVIIGSVAVSNPPLVKKWIQHFGPDRIALAIDIQNGTLAHHGWLANSDQSPSDFMSEMTASGATTFICTDISRDGMLQGTNAELYGDIRRQFGDIELIASGGVASIQDIRALTHIGVSGVVVGRALHEQKVKLEELKSLNT